MQIILLQDGRKMIGFDIVLDAVRLIFTIFGVASGNTSRIARQIISNILFKGIYAFIGLVMSRQGFDASSRRALSHA